MGSPLFPKELIEIKWDVPLTPTDEFLSEDFLRKHSASSKILNDTFTQVWSSDSDDDRKGNKNRKAANKIKYERTFDSRLRHIYKPFKAYPKFSTLTAVQQQAYLQLMKKFTCNHSPFLNKRDQQDLQWYQVLQQKVASEQLEYLEFLREFAISNQSRYSSINPNIKQYIDELWESQLKSCLRYPRYYRAHRTIALVLGNSKDRFDLTPVDVILEMGKLRRLDLDRKKLKINSIYSYFVHKHPIIDYASVINERQVIKKCPVSQDENAEAIAKRVNVNFVLSSSGLKRICDNYPPYNKSWGLPVTVKEVEFEDNGRLTKKRVVFIDKALPRRRLSIIDRIFWFHKIAVKLHLVRPPNLPRNLITLDWDKRRKKDQSDEEDSQIEDDHQSDDNIQDDDPFADNVNMEDLETFGIDGPISAGRKFEGRSGSESKSVKSVLSETIESAPKTESDSRKLDENPESASCADSDSGDENLVIDDPEMISDSENLKRCTKESGVGKNSSKESVAAVVCGGGDNDVNSENPSKPVTRRMAKMLENLNKVQAMVGNKRSNPDEHLLGLKNMKLCSPEGSDTASFKSTCVENKGSEGLCTEQNVNVGCDGGDSKSAKKNLSMLDKLLLEKDRISKEKRDKSQQPRVENEKRSDKSHYLPSYEAVPPSDDGNIVYRLFTLKSKETNAPGFRLLIRCKLDAREFIYKPKPKTRIATIVPKLEFQPEFGAEAVTVSELTWHWLSVRLRPNSFLVRARINAFTSDIMMVEEKEEKDFSREEKYLNTQASCCLNTLNAVLNGLSDLPPGQYILSHEPKMGAFASLLCAVDGKGDGLYDLYKQYDVNPKMEEPQILSSIWKPIDFSIITPLHDAMGRVPGTFNPKNKNPFIKKKKKKRNRTKKEKADDE